MQPSPWSILEHFITPEETLNSLAVSPSPPSNPWQTLIDFLSPWIRLLWPLHVSGLARDVLFSNRPLWLSTVFPRFLHTAALTGTSFIFMVGWCSVVQILHSARPLSSRSHGLFPLLGYRDGCSHEGWPPAWPWRRFLRENVWRLTTVANYTSHKVRCPHVRENERGLCLRRRVTFFRVAKGLRPQQTESTWLRCSLHSFLPQTWTLIFGIYWASFQTSQNKTLIVGCSVLTINGKIIPLFCSATGNQPAQGGVKVRASEKLPR